MTTPSKTWLPLDVATDESVPTASWDVAPHDVTLVDISAAADLRHLTSPTAGLTTKRYRRLNLQ
jgi:hypothetical protein